MRNNRRSVMTVAAVTALVAGCGVGGGTLTGTGGSSAPNGRGGSSTPTAGRGGPMIVGTGGTVPITTTGAGGSTNCGAVAQYATPLSPEIEIVLDTSASMNDPADPTCGAGCASASKWAASVSGINAVVDASPPDVRWGLTFIGGDPNACDLGRVGAVIGGGAVRAGLDLLTSGGALAAPGMRPTRAAIDRATTLLGLTGAGGPRAILLVTDGRPNCDPGAFDALEDDVAGSVTSISTALASGIPTFVVGLGIANVPTDTALSNMAIAGGAAQSGPSAYYPASSSADLVATMNALVASVACEYALPPAVTSGAVYYDVIRVSAGGFAIPRDVDNGWSYADTTETTIQLHGSSCEVVRSNAYAVTISFSCFAQ
jgi:hypothetical protein